MLIVMKIYIYIITKYVSTFFDFIQFKYLLISYWYIINDCFDENGELILNEEEEKELKLTSEKEKNDQNISDGTSQVFNKEIYNSLKRKVSMINQSVEDLVEGMPTILANAYHDLKSAEDVQ